MLGDLSAGGAGLLAIYGVVGTSLFVGWLVGRLIFGFPVLSLRTRIRAKRGDRSRIHKKVGKERRKAVINTLIDEYHTGDRKAALEGLRGEALTPKAYYRNLEQNSRMTFQDGVFEDRKPEGFVRAFFQSMWRRLKAVGHILLIVLFLVSGAGVLVHNGSLIVFGAVSTVFLLAYGYGALWGSPAMKQVASDARRLSLPPRYILGWIRRQIRDRRQAA